MIENCLFLRLYLGSGIKINEKERFKDSALPMIFHPLIENHYLPNCSDSKVFLIELKDKLRDKYIYFWKNIAYSSLNTLIKFLFGKIVLFKFS